ncbi:hypothetical protein [Polyangium aurulentum]|uniref:hypothetical protein n=1 Tax=Polyangium aurulentum TaxID=2567896 RepID=UPI0010AE53F1|nr:hypothetical protein [Polyangium aurulentum]UQA56543.1 hypothetical protein E8A73_035310 [Polyangium aurulentum]
MERGTRPRGKKDTAESRVFPGTRDAGKRAFRIAMAIAILLHLPFVPLRIFDWLNLLLNRPKVELSDMDGEIVVPIDLELDPNEGAPPPPPPPTEPATPDAVPTATASAAKPPPRKDPGDAGVDASPVDAGEDADTPDAEGGDGGDLDAGVAEVGEKDAGAEALAEDAGTGADAGADAESPMAAIEDAGADAAPVAAAEPDAGPRSPTLADPIAAAGGAGGTASKTPNVSVLINSDRIRQHELGTWFGTVLMTIPQWKSFFEDTEIDPIRDLDHMLIAGPQFRDSRKVTATMDYNVSDAKIREAIDIILKRSSPNGKWLPDTPIPAAQAKADNGERIFAMVKGKRLLVVIPAEAKDQLGGVAKTKGFSKSSQVGILLSMVTPSRAFKGLPFEVPSSLKWLRVGVIPRGDGGADVQLETEDASPEDARTHARELTQDLERFLAPFRGPAEILVGKIDTPEFSADGARIKASITVTKKQLRYVLSAAQDAMEKQQRQRK